MLICKSGLVLTFVFCSRCNQIFVLNGNVQLRVDINIVTVRLRIAMAHCIEYLYPCVGLYCHSFQAHTLINRQCIDRYPGKIETDVLEMSCVYI
jgi:hypothetical protein